MTDASESIGPLKLALSMDELFLWRGTPMASGYSALGIAQAMTAALTKHRVRGTYAFSHTAPAEDDPTLFGVFDHWAESGNHVANHTHHHANLNWVTASAYIDDIERTETLIQPWATRAPTRYFRYCMDNWGNTLEKHDTVLAYLRRHGYTPAPISVWFYDTEFLVAHWRAIGRDDREGLAWLRRVFVDTAASQLRVQAAAARAMFNRNPIHIWLIHGTPLAADCLDAILDRFEAMGVTFVSLEEAMADPMNKELVPIITARFLNQVQKWADVRGQSIEDCPPAIFDQIEKISPIAGASYAEIMTGVFKPIAEQLGGQFTRKLY
jgi:peptidoglycan/xylan/chitin deacetylase (PgdA/CDA1 family)